MKAHSFDTLVLGAGLLGSSTAYHLARLGAKNIAVIDAANAWVVGNGGLLYHYGGEDFPAFHQK